MSSQDDTLREQIREAINSQAKTNVNVLSSLHAVLDSLCYIPVQAIEEVADHNSTTINEVWGVASFYTNFRFSPPRENTVEICWGPTCHLEGIQEVIHAVLEDLGMTDEGDSEDVSLRFNTCLGACAQAPVMMVNHELIGKVTKEAAKKRILELRKDE